MYIDWEKYPENYDFLSEEEKTEIMDYLNGPDEWSGERFNDERRAYAAKLLERGIAVEYNWAGDRRKWIFVDQWRAECEWDWMLQCAD